MSSANATILYCKDTILNFVWVLVFCQFDGIMLDSWLFAAAFTFSKYSLKPLPR